jgi:hypothetical protein
MNSKRSFLMSELWMLTFNAAFQRANIYTKEATDHNKSAWKAKLAADIEMNILPLYKKGNVTDEAHINSLNQVDRSFDDKMFQSTSRTYGIAQKILNLYLKYMWIIDEVSFPPPHFPIDRRIQESLKLKPLISWTKEIKSSDDYMAIIERARKCPLVSKYKSLAEMELEEFSRSNLYVQLMKSKK